MIRFRFLLTTVWVVVLLASSTFGKTAAEETKSDLVKDGYWQRFSSGFKGSVCKLPYGYMTCFGISFILIVKFLVWFIGFETVGVHKSTIASFLVRQRGGHIRKNSYLATGQALGARGLGNLLCTVLFLSGAVFGMFVSYLTRRST